MPYKNLENQTGVELTVTLTERKGSDPGSDGPSHKFTLKVNEKKQVEYGEPKNPYLNAISIARENNGFLAIQRQRVITRGCAWDDTLNTKDSFSFNGTHPIDMTSFNS